MPTESKVFFALFKCECVSEIEIWLGFLGFIGIFIFIFHFLMHSMRRPEAKKTYAFTPRQCLREVGVPLPCPTLFLGRLRAFLQHLALKRALRRASVPPFKTLGEKHVLVRT